MEFNETQRQRDGNDIYLPARTNPTEDGKSYEVVIGRHPDEREVRGMKAAFKKPKYGKMSEREFVDSIGHCGCRHPNCWVCFLVGDGVPKRFMKIVDPF